MSNLDEAPLPTPNRTWIFQANPKYFDIDAALATVREMTWSVNQYKQSITPGDDVFVWRSGPDAGIIAEATVMSAPELMEQDGLQFVVQADKFDKRILRVRLRINSLYPVPLSRDVLKARMPDLSIVQSPQGTNFPVTPQEAAVIREMLKAPDEGEDEILSGSPGKSAGTARVWAYAPGPL